MSAFQQMGHHSENLLDEPDLDLFTGAILSPVNYVENEVAAQVASLGERSGYETLFDPQLYYPQTERGHLRQWSYFPTDVDTADLSSEVWWQRVTRSLVETVRPILPTAICSLAVVPRVYDDNYFATLVQVGRYLAVELEGTGIQAVQTAVVQLADLSIASRSLAIASLLSATACDRLYLVFVGDTEPRRELADTEELKGAMRLISALENTGLKVVVGFCSSDLLLWKAAGATTCSTGKFFNLRRFTRSRFEEPSKGGGQLPYFFEESLLAFLRESDIVRLERQRMISGVSRANPFGRQILSNLIESPGRAWVALGWRQFMYWFAEFERRIDSGEVEVRSLLRAAERNWLQLEDADVLMEESRNEGGWLRPWRRALAEFLAD